MRYIDDYTAHTNYDDMLDEVYPDLTVAGMGMSTSRVLKEVDPIAYRVGFSDWCDAEQITTDEDEADEE